MSIKPSPSHVHVGPYAKSNKPQYSLPRDAISSLYQTIIEFIDTLGSPGVLYGFSKKSISLNNNVVRVTLSPGTCVINSSIISVSTDLDIELNLDSYDPSGFLVLSLLHKTDKSNRRQLPLFRIQWVDVSGDNVIPGKWKSNNSDVIILGIFTFSKTGGVVTSVNDITDNYLTTPFTVESDNHYSYGQEGGFYKFPSDNRINGIPISSLSPSNGDILIYDATTNEFTFSNILSGITNVEYSF